LALASDLGWRGSADAHIPRWFSRLGILRADVVREFSQTVLLAVPSPPSFHRNYAGDSVHSERRQTRSPPEGFVASKDRIEQRLDMRYAGQEYELRVPATAISSLALSISRHAQR